MRKDPTSLWAASLHRHRFLSCVRLGKREPSINKQAWEYGCFCFSLFLTGHMVWLASWSPCLDFPTVLDCNLKFWVEINPFLLELLLARAFDHSNRNEAWTSPEVPTCSLPCKTLIGLCGRHLHLRVHPGQHTVHLNCFCVSDRAEWLCYCNSITNISFEQLPLNTRLYLNPAVHLTENTHNDCDNCYTYRTT